MSDAAFYECRGVSRSFENGGRVLEILRDVTFSVAEGELLSVLGLSGSGKSTLLHLMGLLDRPSTGDIRFLGQEIGSAPESVRTALRATEFAFVFQFYYLLPEFDALENVMFPARIAASSGFKHRAPTGAAERRDRAEELLKRVGLGERLRHRPHQLSGGERQRTAIARALMNRPRIVFCDEPTGNLDPRTAAEVHSLFRELNESLGQTFVVVTHDPRMAAASKRRIHLEDGRIADEATPASSMTPATPMTSATSVPGSAPEPPRAE
jgi:lipoprotein-releasing system ATP-binding protein